MRSISLWIIIIIIIDDQSIFVEQKKKKLFQLLLSTYLINQYDVSIWKWKHLIDQFDQSNVFIFNVFFFLINLKIKENPYIILILEAFILRSYSPEKKEINLFTTNKWFNSIYNQKKKVTAKKNCYILNKQTKKNMWWWNARCECE